MSAAAWRALRCRPWGVGRARRSQAIETVLRAVLRAGAYELDRRSDVPARIVVSEYVDVANAFVDRDETGLINAVLDQLARQLRPGEFDPV